MAIMFIIIVTSSSRKSNVCFTLYAVQVYKHQSPSCAIQKEPVPVAHVSVYHARRYHILLWLMNL